MEYFQFKRFKVKNIASAMKLGTDSVLLGAWAPLLPTDLKVLDVGTGTGVVALMMAQRAEALGEVPVQIDAIDIDLPSVEEAAHNFSISPWSDALRAVHIPLQEHTGEYDLIVSNPPYFIDSLKAPESRRSQTRHTDSLPHEDLIAAAFSLLKMGGRMVVILPKDEGEAFIRSAQMYSVGRGSGSRLCLSKLCRVHTSHRKPPKRYLMEFTLAPATTVLNPCEQEDISLNDDENYVSLVRDFLLKYD